MIRALFGWLLRLLCYGGLMVAVAGTVATIIAANQCARFDEGGVRCASAWVQSVGDFAMTFVLITAFTGIPLLLAFGGLVFLYRDVRAWRRRRAAG